MPAEHQNELFQEFEKKKGGLEKIADRITERRKKFYATLALENIVFGIIIIIMCFVVAFALGVERGKRLVPAPVEIEKATVAIAPVAAPEPVLIEPVSVEPAPRARYTIQLISYKREKRALREKKELTKHKIDAFITKSDNWYQLCTGSYKDMKAAKEALASLRDRYKGCFVKNL